MHPEQENIIQSGEPSGSALRVAALRAVHQLRDDPLVFSDPLALRILGPQAEAALRADPFQFNDRIANGMRAVLAVRSRLAEDELLQAVKAGVTQYVVLGAGLDTFAFRNDGNESGVRVYEVDHPSTQTWKKGMLEAAGIAIPDSMRFVAVDFEKDGLAEELRKAGFRADLPACFSWLGVTMYLPEQAIFETLKFVAAMPKGSTITFDYLVAPALLGLRDRMAREYLAKVLAEQGEPWKSDFEPPAFHAALRDLGFRRTVDFGPDELNARYMAQRKDELLVRGGFRIMCAQT